LNKVPAIVPLLNRYDLIISSMMRHSSGDCAIPYSHTHRPVPSPSYCQCLLSFDSPSTNRFWHVKFKQKK